MQYLDSLATGDCGLNMSTFAYAGWNTDGNTLGTVLANTVLLTLFGTNAAATRQNTYFNTLRLVEVMGGGEVFAGLTAFAPKFDELPAP